MADGPCNEHLISRPNSIAIRGATLFHILKMGARGCRTSLSRALWHLLPSPKGSLTCQREITRAINVIGNECGTPVVESNKDFQKGIFINLGMVNVGISTENAI